MVSNILRPPRPKKPEKENEPPSESQPCTSAHLQLPLAQCSDVQVPTTLNDQCNFQEGSTSPFHSTTKTEQTSLSTQCIYSAVFMLFSCISFPVLKGA